MVQTYLYVVRGALIAKRGLELDWVDFNRTCVKMKIGSIRVAIYNLECTLSEKEVLGTPARILPSETMA